MQAIHTKYHGPTNSRGSTIRATCDRGSITIPYPHELSGDDVHRAAVKALVDKFIAEDKVKYPGSTGAPWNWPYVSGGLPNNNGMVHVSIRPEPDIKEALEHFVACYCPADGSDLKWEALNDAYKVALQALGITHDSRMTDGSVDATDQTNPLANDMR